MSASMFADTAEYEETMQQAAMFRWMRDHHACVIRPTVEQSSPFHCLYIGGTSLITMGPGADGYAAAVRAAMEQSK